VQSPRPALGFTNRRVPDVRCCLTIDVEKTHPFPPRYQWVFITDTVDAIYRPDGWSPDAMMDRLAEVASYAPSSQVKLVNVITVSSTCTDLLA
jgi:hypothetical protein